MKLIKALLLILIFFISVPNLYAQDKGFFSGDLQMNTRFFERDSARNAFNTPFYDYLFYGAEAWLSAKYRIKGFEVGGRLDLFQNSYVLNPTVPASKEGLGRWYISKRIDQLDITGGYFYEQFGTGTILRAYEARGLGIDQAIFGLRMIYQLNDNWTIKGVTGKYKNQANLQEIELYNPIIKGLNVEGYIKLKDKMNLRPGFSVVNRTIDANTMEPVFLEIDSYLNPDDRFIPKFNTNLFSLYNKLNWGKFGWYLEGAFKTEDVVRDLSGKLINPKQGWVVFQNLSYSRKGLGILFQTKYTKNFDFRVGPNETNNAGLIHFLPALTKQNTYRLLSRYNAATQMLGELAFQADIVYTPKRGRTFNFNFSNLSTLENDLLWREIYLDADIKLNKKWKMIAGIQAIDYNQQVYESKGDYVHTLTPFVEFTHKFTRRNSLKMELSYMLTKRNYKLFGEEDPNPDKPQDLGDWLWVLAEYSMAPKWSFALSDLYNVESNIHYPIAAISYTQNATRFGLSYTKQPDGVVCTGGVCRYEPAFSGVQFGVVTSF